MQVFKLDRGYKELIERVGWKKTNYMKYLPCDEADIAVVGEDNENNNDFITYLVVTDNSKGDRTMLNRDKVYEIMIWGDHIDYNSIVENYKELNNLYIDNHNIRYSIKKDLYRPKIRLLFDDMG